MDSRSRENIPPLTRAALADWWVGHPNSGRWTEESFVELKLTPEADKYTTAVRSATSGQSCASGDATACQPPADLWLPVAGTRFLSIAPGR